MVYLLACRILQFCLGACIAQPLPVTFAITVHITDSDVCVVGILEATVSLAAAMTGRTPTTNCDEVTITRLLSIGWAGRVPISTGLDVTDDEEAKRGKGSRDETNGGFDVGPENDVADVNCRVGRLGQQTRYCKARWRPWAAM